MASLRQEYKDYRVTYSESHHPESMLRRNGGWMQSQLRGKSDVSIVGTTILRAFINKVLKFPGFNDIENIVLS